MVQNEGQIDSLVGFDLQGGGLLETQLRRRERDSALDNLIANQRHQHPDNFHSPSPRIGPIHISRAVIGFHVAVHGR
jgi:hypothetical protein